MASDLAFASPVKRATLRNPQSDLLKTLRERLGGISQEVLAHRIGVSWSTVSRWENGKGTPSPLAREKLKGVLKEAGLEDSVDEGETDR
jgi:putative transcriptional regulator